MDGSAVCRHCFLAPPHSRLGLCTACSQAPAIRLLYLKKRRGWSPGWEGRLEQLAVRAFLRLPLFPLEPFDEEPRRPPLASQSSVCAG